MRRGIPIFAPTFGAAAITLACLACGAAAPPEPAPSPRAAPAPRAPAAPNPAAPAWTYWEAVDLPPAASGVDRAAAGAANGPSPYPSVDLPLATAQLERSPAADARWSAASAAIRQSVEARGFAVAPAVHPLSRLGDFYASLRDDRIPWVITLDALFFLAHFALDRALSDVDAAVVEPSLSTMLRRLRTGLATQSRRAPADMGPAYVVARGLVAVALALAPAEPAAAWSNEPFVAQEKARVLSHAGVAASPWLRAPIDYSAMSPPAMAGRGQAGGGWFRAAAWLENTSLSLEGAGERGGDSRSAPAGAGDGRVDVATARAHARAALLIARLLDSDVDAEAAAAWARIERAAELCIGDADDVTPRDLAVAAQRAEVDVRSDEWLANVAWIDRVRHGAARARSAPVFHVLAARTTPDGELLQSLTYPVIGALVARYAPSPSGVEVQLDPPRTARDGMRALPTGLDVAAWLGSGEARSSLGEAGDDAYERYEDTLQRLMRARPPAEPLGTPGRHRTPYLSMLDAIETWLAPSAGDGVEPAASATGPWARRKAEVALAAWTELRHDATSLSRVPSAPAHLPPRETTPSTVPVFVEAHPEAIAKLVGLVRQTVRALVGEGVLGGAAPAVEVLGEVEDLLWTALGAAAYEAADQPLPPELEDGLASFPARVRALEAVAAETGGADVPLAADVHVDVQTARVLEQATGRIEEAWVVMREPRTHRLWLALGASIPRYEIIGSASARLNDDVWRTRLRHEGEPPHSPLAQAYVTVP